MSKSADVIIIGAGPAGLAAGLYAGRSKLDVVIFEKSAVGGQIVITAEVANYPAAPEHSTGPSIVGRMREQAEEFGAKIVKADVTEVDFTGEMKKVVAGGEEYEAKAVIIASGRRPNLLGVPGERELTSKGVSYCATCDADFFDGMEVFVVGGGDSAVEEAMYLTKFARKVTIVHRRNELRAAKSIQERAFANERMAFMWDTVVEEIKGDGIVESVVFKNVKTGETNEYFADEEDGTFGIFPFVGFVPLSDVFKGKVEMDDKGYIIASDDTVTNVHGVFAAGDIRVKNLRQVVTAAADGAIAAVAAEKYIAEMEGKVYEEFKG